MVASSVAATMDFDGGVASCGEVCKSAVPPIEVGKLFLGCGLLLRFGKSLVGASVADRVPEPLVGLCVPGKGGVVCVGGALGSGGGSDISLTLKVLLETVTARGSVVEGV